LVNQFNPGLLENVTYWTENGCIGTIYNAHDVHRLMKILSVECTLYTAMSKNATGTAFGNWIITKRCWKYENNIATPPDTFPAYRSSRVINVGSKKLLWCTEICAAAVVMCSAKQCQTDPSILISSYHKRPGAPPPPFLFPATRRVLWMRSEGRKERCSRKQLECITNYICAIKTNQNAKI